jgi:glutaredoxin
MKKYLLFGIVALLIIMPLAGAFNQTPSEQPSNTLSTPLVTNGFTHTVFAEYGTTTTCPHCPGTSNALYSIYQSGDYPFYYVSLISNANSNAGKRLWNFRAVAVPVVYFDGGDINEVGNVGEIKYRSIIEDSGEREVKQPLDMTSDVTWEGSAQITVSISIKNNRNFFYIGILRSFITEIESRWNDADGDPYHFGFLDFAFNRPILLLPGGERTFTKTWDGANPKGDQTFEDITEDNIMVLSSVSHWIPHKRTGYADRTYYAFIVDQADGAIPS